MESKGLQLYLCMCMLAKGKNQSGQGDMREAKGLDPVLWLISRHILRCFLRTMHGINCLVHATMTVSKHLDFEIWMTQA